VQSFLIVNGKVCQQPMASLILSTLEREPVLAWRLEALDVGLAEVFLYPASSHNGRVGHVFSDGLNTPRSQGERRRGKGGAHLRTVRHTMLI
jgi:hypothetical protein